MKKYYTGIGSRNTPLEICELMTKISEYLYLKDYVLRSGGADGADLAFEKGAKDKKEIYIPWKNFNNSKSNLYNIPKETFRIVKSVHEHWAYLNKEQQKLHKRNVCQVYGYDLNTLSDFVICWTVSGKIVGGTATAIKLAKIKNIPVFNLGIEEHKDRILKVL